MIGGAISFLSVRATASDRGKRGPVVWLLIQGIAPARHLNLGVPQRLCYWQRVANPVSVKAGHQFGGSLGIHWPKGGDNRGNSSHDKGTRRAYGSFAAVLLLYSGLAARQNDQARARQFQSIDFIRLQKAVRSLRLI